MEIILILFSEKLWAQCLTFLPSVGDCHLPFSVLFPVINTFNMSSPPCAKYHVEYFIDSKKFLPLVRWQNTFLHDSVWTVKLVTAQGKFHNYCQVFRQIAFHVTVWQGNYFLWIFHVRDYIIIAANTGVMPAILQFTSAVCLHCMRWVAGPLHGSSCQSDITGSGCQSRGGSWLTGS